MPNKPKLHAFSGTHGTGKTTAAFQYAEILSKENPGKTVGIVVDIERQCPYPINRNGNNQSQEWIFLNQIEAESQAIANNDIVVTDRTIFDPIAYTQQLGLKSLAEVMLMFAKVYMNRYSRINFLCTRSHSWAIDDGVRDCDPLYRSEVENLMLSLYHEAGISNQERFVLI
jgi:predicted ATPase